MSALPLPKAIFFDWDGTIADTIPFLKEAHSHVRVQMGMKPWSEEEFWELVGHSTREGYHLIYGEDTHKAREILIEYVRANHLKDLKPMAGAKELLETVRKLKIPMAVVSNKMSRSLQEQVKHLGWEGYFISVVGAGDADKDKPSPDPLYLAIKQGGIELDTTDIWYVGDTETDLKLSKNTGATAVFIHHHAHMAPLIETYNPPVVVKNCSELNGFLLQTA